MVLSTTKRTASISSIVNRNQGGGEKKSGLPRHIGKETWTSMFINHGRIMPGHSAVKTVVSYMTTPRPVGFRSGHAYGFAPMV